jgi:hypothetical protein
MSGTRFEVSTWRFVATLALVACVSACGGGGGDEGGKGGGGGQEETSSGGSSGEGGSKASGGSNEGGAGKAGGSGGSAMAGMAGMAGATPPVGGTMGMVDATKEREWIDADITFGPNGSITHNQPMNWFSPNDYYNGSMEVRADIISGTPGGYYGFELCLYKSGPGDAVHNCLPLLCRQMGGGQRLKTHPRTSIILRNVLAQDLTENDFKIPWAANNTPWWAPNI